MTKDTEVRKPSQPANFLQSLSEVVGHEFVLQRALVEVVSHAYLNNELEHLLRDIDTLKKQGIPSDYNIVGLNAGHLDEVHDIALKALTDSKIQIASEDATSGLHRADRS